MDTKKKTPEPIRFEGQPATPNHSTTPTAAQMKAMADMPHNVLATLTQLLAHGVYDDYDGTISAQAMADLQRVALAVYMSHINPLPVTFTARTPPAHRLLYLAVTLARAGSAELRTTPQGESRMALQITPNATDSTIFDLCAQTLTPHPILQNYGYMLQRLHTSASTARRHGHTDVMEIAAIADREPLPFLGMAWTQVAASMTREEAA